jgi:polygalacturonase
MRNCISTLLFLLVLSACNNHKKTVIETIEPFNTPFGNFNFVRPVFPQKSLSIVDFGAKEGGIVNNTEAIKMAIQQLSAEGGGTVIVPKGKWLTGPIHLLSNINLHLEEGSELLFSQQFNDYLPAVLSNWEGSDLYNYSPFIYAYKQENIAITGSGILNGQGKPWWEQRSNGDAFNNSNQLLRNMNNNGVPVSERRFGTLDKFLPPPFFGPLHCKNILLEGVTFKYGAFWTINPSYCNNIIIRRLYVLTNDEYGDTPNGDGINPNSCQNVLIEYNTLDTGDDCITIKSNRDKDGRNMGIPCKNILIRHNKGLQGHGGIVIGSEMSGGVENVYAHDCQFNGTDRIIRIKTNRGRGGYVRNCWFKNISADTILKEAIRINMLYTGGDRLPAQDINDETPSIENIHYENITCNYSSGNIIQIIGLPEMPVKNVTFNNIRLGGRLGVEITDAQNVSIKNLFAKNDVGSAASILFSDNVALDSMTIAATDKNTIPVAINNASNIRINNISYPTDGKVVKISGQTKNIEIDKKIPSNLITYE